MNSLFDAAVSYYSTCLSACKLVPYRKILQVDNTSESCRTVDILLYYCLINMSSFTVDKVSVKSLPEELIRSIFIFLDANSLLQVELACLLWRKICVAYDEDLWKQLTVQLWSNFVHNRLETVNLLSRIQQLPLTKLKKALIHIDLSRCVEKKDFQRMLMARLVFEKVMKKELAGNDPRFAGRYLSMYYPDWSLTMGIYKMSYLHSRKDISRQEIMQSELCQNVWRFRFKADPGPVFESKFYPDYTVRSTMRNEEYRWKFVYDESDKDGNNNHRKIQVENFPYISSRRLPDGSWFMEDIYVTLHQRDSLDGNSLPLLDNE